LRVLGSHLGQGLGAVFNAEGLPGCPRGIKAGNRYQQQSIRARTDSKRSAWITGGAGKVRRGRPGIQRPDRRADNCHDRLILAAQLGAAAWRVDEQVNRPVPPILPMGQGADRKGLAAAFASGPGQPPGNGGVINPVYSRALVGGRRVVHTDGACRASTPGGDDGRRSAVFGHGVCGRTKGDGAGHVLIVNYGQHSRFRVGQGGAAGGGGEGQVDGFIGSGDAVVAYDERKGFVGAIAVRPGKGAGGSAVIAPSHGRAVGGGVTNPHRATRAGRTGGGNGHRTAVFGH